MASIDPQALSEHFVRASGPGGQNVNKVASAVQLRFDLSKSALSDEIKSRLRALAGSKLTTDDVLIVDAREYRTQAQNREAARARLEHLVQQAMVRPKKRRPTKATKASRERRLEVKKRKSATKRLRQRGADD